MTRTPVVAANWKAVGTLSSITKLIEVFNEEIVGKKVGENVDVIVAPGTAHLLTAKGQVRNRISIAAQNCIVKSGAFTGEVSAEQLKDLGIEYVILGHSERRWVFGETDKVINAKAKAALAKGLKVIYCIGERLEEREAGATKAVCDEQLAKGLGNLTHDEWKNVIIAYEPVWAIGTGKVATPEQAQQAINENRQWVAQNISPSVAAEVRILYGGSVNAKNVASLWKGADIDGFLVGGASTKPEFVKLVAAGSVPKL